MIPSDIKDTIHDALLAELQSNKEAADLYKHKSALYLRLADDCQAALDWLEALEKEQGE